MSRSMNQLDCRVCLTRGDHVLLTGRRNPRKNKIRSNETVGFTDHCPPSPQSEISGPPFDSPFLSTVLFFCLVVLLVLSCHFFLLMAHPPDFFYFLQKTIFSLRVRLFCMALVEHLWDDSWYVVCAACSHMAQVFAIVHLYTFNKSFLSRSPPPPSVWYR